MGFRIRFQPLLCVTLNLILENLNSETFIKYEITVKEFLDLVSDFLSDEEKLRLFDYSHFMQINGTAPVCTPQGNI